MDRIGRPGRKASLATAIAAASMVGVANPMGLRKQRNGYSKKNNKPTGNASAQSLKIYEAKEKRLRKKILRNKNLMLSENGKIDSDFFKYHTSYELTGPILKDNKLYYDLESWSKKFKQMIKSPNLNWFGYSKDLIPDGNKFLDLIENIPCKAFVINVEDYVRIVRNMANSFGQIGYEDLNRFGYNDPYDSSCAKWLLLRMNPDNELVEDLDRRMLVETRKELSRWFQISLDHGWNIYDKRSGYQFDFGHEWISAIDDDPENMVHKVANTLYFLLLNGVMTTYMEQERFQLYPSLERRNEYDMGDTMIQISHVTPFLGSY